MYPGLPPSSAQFVSTSFIHRSSLKTAVNMSPLCPNGSSHKGAIWLVRVEGSPPGQNRNLRNKGRRRHILLAVVRHAEPP